MLKVAVTGGRSYSDREHVYGVLSELHRSDGIERLWQGGASGADRLALEWGRYVGFTHVLTFRAKWKMYGNAAGPIRNQEMIDAGPDVLVAFPGNDGTNDCVRRAVKAGVRVMDLRGHR